MTNRQSELCLLPMDAVVALTGHMRWRLDRARRLAMHTQFTHISECYLRERVKQERNPVTITCRRAHDE